MSAGKRGRSLSLHGTGSAPSRANSGTKNYEMDPRRTPLNSSHSAKNHERTALVNVRAKLEMAASVFDGHRVCDRAPHLLGRGRHEHRGGHGVPGLAHITWVLQPSQSGR